jgi:hypothetical protein
LRARTGLTLIAAGAILLLAVRVRLSFLNVPATGLILIADGLAWLWIPVRAKRVLVRRYFDRVMSYLQWEASDAGERRHALTELLGDGTGSLGDGAAVSRRPGTDSAESALRPGRQQCP